MRTPLDPFAFVVMSLGRLHEPTSAAGHPNLIEENRVLRKQIGTHRMRFSDDQRRRLRAKAKKIGRKLLNDVATVRVRLMSH